MILPHPLPRLRTEADANGQSLAVRLAATYTD